MTVINVLRQYSAGSHNAAIRHLARRDGHEITTHEYDITSNVWGVVGNLTFAARALLQMEGKRLVLGAEPYDPRVPLFHRVARRNHVVLHTSWPYWETKRVPQPPRFEWQRKRWQRFLADVHAVGVTEASVASVLDAGAGDATHIPHSIDTNVYHPDAGSRERDEPVVLFVGRLEQRKGVSELLELISAWEDPEARFWFVGDGPLAEDVSALAVADDHVEYFGYVADDERLADLYASADVFTLPSYRVDDWEELFGIVVIEALSCGLPVVATDCVGPAEIVEEGKTGHIVPQHDIDALRDGLAALLAAPERRARMGERAREVAVNRYDNDNAADQWRRVLGL